MHSKPKIPDFDTLVEMFRQDPESYDNFRRRLLEEAVAESPSQHRQRMQDTLVRIEMARRAASTPLEAAVYASKLMRESLDELGDRMRDLQEELTGMQSLLVLHRIKNLPPVTPERRSGPPRS